MKEDKICKVEVVCICGKMETVKNVISEKNNTIKKTPIKQIK